MTAIIVPQVLKPMVFLMSQPKKVSSHLLRYSGNLLVEAGGTITAGDAVASNENGKAVKAADDAIVNGYALDSGASGDEIRIVRGI